MNEPHLIVLFGATGDLARRKLLPGIMHLLQSGLVPDSRIIGVSMDDFDDDSFRDFAEKAYREFSTRPVDDAQWKEFAPKLSYVNVSAGPDALASAAAVLEACRHPPEPTARDENGGTRRALACPRAHSPRLAPATGVQVVPGSDVEPRASWTTWRSLRTTQPPTAAATPRAIPATFSKARAPPQRWLRQVVFCPGKSSW